MFVQSQVRRALKPAGQPEKWWGQEYFRTHRPPLLAVWGKNDPFFLPKGADAYRRDIPDAEVLLFDTGHFALETHAVEIAAAINEFLAAKEVSQ